MDEIVEYDVIVVGTGAGGSTVARELSKNGLKVLVLEKGEEHEQGTGIDHIKTAPVKLIYEDESLKYLEFFKQQAEIMYMEGIGGTTPVSLANACYACTSCYKNSATSQFNVHDIKLFKELLEASNELKVGSLPLVMMGSATLNLVDVAKKLGYFMEPMPKFIAFENCVKCGSCIQGCTRYAKWDGKEFIQELTELKNTTVITNFTVTRALHEKNIVKGVEGTDIHGERMVHYAPVVVISAGALNTPKILIDSDVTGAGNGLFTDLFITVGGYLKDVRLNREIPMGVKSEFGPYFISPHYSSQLITPIKEKGFDPRPEDVMGLMVKIADDATGTIMPDGNIIKIITKRDSELLKEGYKRSKELLIELGVEPESISITALRGAHPGGTAAIGVVVDKNLETCVKGLYIADASVIPQAPGRPPILTITALAKKLSKHINRIYSKKLL